MKEQAEVVLAEMLQKAMDGVDAATEFSKEQIPEVVEQLLRWHMIESALLFSLSIVLLLVISIGYLIGFSKFKDRHDEMSAVFIGGGAAVNLFAIPTFSLVAVFNLDWLQILVAPKLYLLEYAASLVK